MIPQTLTKKISQENGMKNWTLSRKWLFLKHLDLIKW
jgi:hypothetical protein